jgi:hypothetical protein
MTQRSVTKDFTAVPSQVTIWGRHLSGTATPPYLGRHEQNPTNLLKKKGKNRLFSGTVYVDIRCVRYPACSPATAVPAGLSI